MDKKALNEKEIRKVLDLMAEAFAEKDIEKYLGLFTKESDLVIFGSQAGEKWTSISDYKKSVLKDWSYPDKMTVHYDWLKIKSSESIAWLASDIRFETKVGEQTMSIPGRFTAVLIKDGNEWKFNQSHFSMAMQSPE
ncbi:MAG: nuclear transport factor 2 family protein [Asgard group archaeon]|nr:nuclear transport factor 2 family protein [Asgard group archaeon]